MSNIIKVTNGDTVYITVSDVFTIKPNAVTATELNVSGNGTSGQVLSSDGDGSFSWVAQSAGSAGVGLALTGSTFSLSHLGLESLSDPNADRIAFWDDSTSTFAWLEIGGNLTISGTTLNATDTQRSVETIQDIVGDMFTLGNTETLITATYQDFDGTIDLVVDNNLANYDNSTSGFLTAHPTIAAASSVDNSGRTYIQDITLDSNGHVIGLVSATETVTDTTYDLSSATNVADANNVDIKLVGSDSTTDTVTLKAGTNITLSDDGSNNITITSTASGGGGGMTSWTISDGTNSEDINDGDTLTIAGGGDISTSYNSINNVLTVSFTETYTAHESIAAPASVDNSGRTYIQDITLDVNGHVTGIASATETVTDTTYDLTSAQNNFDVDITLTGSDSTTDTLKLKAGTNITLTDNAAGQITIDASGGGSTYTAGAGLDLTGTVFSVESDLRSDVFYIGQNASDYIFVDLTAIDFYLDGNLDMRLENDGDLHVDGDVIAYSTTTSDAKFKDDVETIQSASEKVSQLRGVMFTWNATSRKGQRDMGVIAQEVEAVIPEIVREKTLKVGEFEENTTTAKTVDYEKLVALLIESNKEQQEIISQLEERVIDLENRL